jgi:hypothetical protein
MVIYDFSFEYVSDAQRYVCMFKAMAATNTIDEVEFAISLPDEYKRYTFLTENIINVNTENPVTSMTELILAQAQAGQPDPFDEPSAPIVNRIADASDSFVIAVPVKIEGDDFTSAAGDGVRVYVNLNYVVNFILNRLVVPYHEKAKQFEISKPIRYKLQEYIDITGAELLFSPNPLEIVFPGDDAASTYIGKVGGSTQPVLTFNNVIGQNGFSKCIDGNKLYLGNILISLDALIALEKQVADIKDQKSKADTTDESSRSNVLLSIKDFIKKISAIVNKNSGGLIDLVSYQPEGKDEFIEIVDRNYRNAGKISPLVFNNRFPGDGVTMQAAIKAEVPKDAIAMNAYLNNIKGVTTNAINEASTAAKEAKRERIVKYELAKIKITRTGSIINVKETLASNNFKEESRETAARVIREYVQNRPIDIMKAHSNSPYPLKLTLTLAGVHGFRFGDVITLKYLPFQYKDQVCFRIIRHTHKFEGLNWSTEIETVCDLI